MDSFELSKIGAAILLAALAIVAPKVIIDAKLASHDHVEAGYEIPVKAAEAAAVPAPAPAAADTAGTALAPAADAGKAAAAPADGAPAPNAPAAPAPAAAAGGFDAKAVVAMLATANVEDGAAAFKGCATCHVSKKDAASTAGPNLWGIVNRPKAAQADFASKYSTAMKEKGGEWSYENLAAFVHKPKDYVKGTKMVYNGMKDPAQIAALIAYLRTLSDSPVALP